MAKIGDTIQVRIGGGEKGMKVQGNNGVSIGMGPGASMSVPGVIVQDLGNRWLVKLSMSLGSANVVEVPK